MGFLSSVACHHLVLRTTSLKMDLWGWEEVMMMTNEPRYSLADGTKCEWYAFFLFLIFLILDIVIYVLMLTEGQWLLLI